MFTIIYEKETGRIISITNKTEADELRAVLPADKDFIFVDEVPNAAPYRQYLIVEGGKLMVKDMEISPEREKENRAYELNAQIEQLKMQLASWDYKTSKHADGDYTDEEWQAIVAQRKAWREEIRSLEVELSNIHK